MPPPGRPAERLIGGNPRGGARRDVRLEQAARRRDQRPQLGIRQPADGCERVDAAHEEDFRPVDVPDAGDGPLIEQRVADGDLGALAQAVQRELRVECAGEEVGPELAEHAAALQVADAMERGHGHMEGHGHERRRLDDDAREVPRPPPALARTIDVP